MNLTTSLREILVRDLACAALQGDRVYPMRMEAATEFPCSTISRITGERIQQHAHPPTLHMRRFQVDAWSPDQDEAERLAAAIGAALDRFAGVAAGAQIQQIVVLDDPPDMYDAETQLFHTPVEALVAVTV